MLSCYFWGTTVDLDCRSPRRVLSEKYIWASKIAEQVEIHESLSQSQGGIIHQERVRAESILWHILQGRQEISSLRSIMESSSRTIDVSTYLSILLKVYLWVSNRLSFRHEWQRRHLIPHWKPWATFALWRCWHRSWRSNVLRSLDRKLQTWTIAASERGVMKITLIHIE